jgi:hypothetical protein
VAISEAEAVARYPELELLRTIKAAGRTFRARFDGVGELLAIEGWRDWPDGWRDAIVITDSADACAGRALADEMVWAVEGTLNDVVDLLVLPAPSDPAAPRLVVGSAPLWTPQDA